MKYAPLDVTKTLLRASNEALTFSEHHCSYVFSQLPVLQQLSMPYERRKKLLEKQSNPTAWN